TGINKARPKSDNVKGEESQLFIRRRSAPALRLPSRQRTADLPHYRSKSASAANAGILSGIVSALLAIGWDDSRTITMPTAGLMWIICPCTPSASKAPSSLWLIHHWLRYEYP